MILRSMVLSSGMRIPAAAGATMSLLRLMMIMISVLPSFVVAFGGIGMMPMASPTTFSLSPLVRSRQSKSACTTGTTATALSCICIDCKWVTSCKAYHFVETKHEQPHMTNEPTFMPRNGSPTIHVNIRTIRTTDEQEAERKRMWREHAAETERARAKATDSAPLHGEQVYDLAGATTYEYDVVKCEDFVLDKGCWIRNMPEAIKLANPDFVPT